MKRRIELNLSNENAEAAAILSEDFKQLDVKALSTISEGQYKLIITYDTNNINNRTGRNRITPEREYTLGEVLRMKKSMGAEKAAKVIKISKATLYRRLKDYEGKSEDTIFLTGKNINTKSESSNIFKLLT